MSNNLEIERKFLIEDKNYINELYKKEIPLNIKQGYIDISINNNNIICNNKILINIENLSNVLNFDIDVSRIRLVKENNIKKAYLTLKSKNLGIIRNELEYEIDYDLANSILPKEIIEKDRFKIINKDNKIWEIDVFKGENEGLFVAEIELNDENEEFEKLAITKREISNDTRFYNNNLLKNPYKNLI